MRDDEQGLALRQRGDAALDLVLVFGVGEGGGLVEDDDGRVFEHHARDGDALLFAAGQALARFTDRRVIALRQLPDELFTLRGAGGSPDLFIRCLRVAEPDVFQQRAAEQEIVLRHKADVLGKLRERHVLDIDAADGDRAAADVPEARDQLGHSRFAAAGRPDQRRKAALGEIEINAVQDFILLLAGVGKMDIFEGYARMRDFRALRRLRQGGQLQIFLQPLDGEFDLPHVLGEDLQLCQRPDHGDGQHDGQRSLRRGDRSAAGQRQRRRKRSDQRGREEGEAQLHGHEGRGQPFDHEGAKIRDRRCIFFVTHTRAAEGLDDFDALNVLDDGAVHVARGSVIFRKAFAADLERQPHAQERQRKRDKGSQRQPPVDAQQRRNAHDGQYDMPRALRDHMRQRRLEIFNLIHHHALDLADGARFHVAERRAQKPVGQPPPEPGQDCVGHAVRNAGGQAEQ